MLIDLIDSGAVPTVRPTEIFRQAQASRILVNAHRINRGELPLAHKPEQGISDFYLISPRSQAIHGSVIPKGAEFRSNKYLIT